MYKTFATLAFLTMEHTCISLHIAHAYKWDVCLPGCSLCNYLPPYFPFHPVFSSLSAPLVLIHYRRWGGGFISAAPLLFLPASCSHCVMNMSRQHPPPPPHASKSPHNGTHLHLQADLSAWSLPLAQTLTGFPVFNLSQGSYINKQCALNSPTHIRLLVMYNNITSRVYPLSGADCF